MKNSMKAIIYHKYGTVEALKLENIKIPQPKSDEVLIKVHAASINNWDWDLLRGKPLLTRLEGLFSPKYPVLGADVAGVVEKVGPSVHKFKVGDEVFGDLSGSNWGGYAEYTCANENAIVHKPGFISFEQAASLPQAACMAYQSFDGSKEIQPGDKVLINGAGGGVGTFAIQIAKDLGADITCVDRGDKFELMKSLGADHVIDFTKEDFTSNGVKYDFILDVIAHHPIKDYQRALSASGQYVMIGGLIRRILQLFLFKKRLTKNTDQTMDLLLAKPNYKLEEILELVKDDKITPVIDQVLSLEETYKAFEHIGSGNTLGKTIIKLVY